MRSRLRFGVLFLVLTATASIVQAALAVKWRGVPPTVKQNTAIYPAAHAIRGSYDLDDIKVWYSWDNSNWTLALHNASPDNANPWAADGDYLGGMFGLTQTGTFYLKSTVVDTSSASVTSYASVTVTSSTAGLPSIMAGKHGSYNYGVAWMHDASDGKQKCWWTMGHPLGGDAIGYSEGTSAPPGSAAVSMVLEVNSTNNAARRLLSNPTVVKDSFTYNGSSYSYIMYFVANTGAVAADTKDTIECSFSTNGTTWTLPITTSITTANSNWDHDNLGIASPNLIRVSSGIYKLFYTDISNADAYGLYVRSSTDGQTWGSASAVSTSGLPDWTSGIGHGSLGCNPSIAYGVESGTPYYFMSYTSQPSNGVTLNNLSVYIYKIQASQLSSGTWTQVLSYSDVNTLYFKSNPGMLRDVYGHVYGSPTTAFSASTKFNENNVQAEFCAMNLAESQLWFIHN